MKKILLKLYYHFNKSPPQDFLEVLGPIVFTPIAIINFIIFMVLFFSQNTIYSIDPKTYEIILITTPEQRAIIGNQLVAFLFIGFGWILVPLLRAIYTHKLTTATSVYMLVASLGLYTIFWNNIIGFGLVVFILIVRNTELSERLSKIKETKIFKQIYQKLFPTIPH